MNSLEGMTTRRRADSAADGNFYGQLTLAGPSAWAQSSKSPRGGVLTTLYSFGESAGGSVSEICPSKADSSRDGNFHGTTFQGGANRPSTWAQSSKSPAGTLTIFLYSLECLGGSDGSYPQAGADGKPPTEISTGQPIAQCSG